MVMYSQIGTCIWNQVDDGAQISNVYREHLSIGM